MKCMQTQLLGILPVRIRTAIMKEDIPRLTEIRLRLDRPGELIMTEGFRQLDGLVSGEDLQFCVNTASRYSPWSAAGMKDGFLTAPGGHRIGLCGEWTGNGFRSLTSVCIRVSKDLPGISAGIPLHDSLLILGPPGSGKTTLLRDLIRRISREDRGSIAVVDERCELFPAGKCGFDEGFADVLSGCPKKIGIPMVLRTMGPSWIALDEITASEDCDALVQAGWCGVKLVATAHASGIPDLMARPVYEPLMNTRLFRNVVVLDRNKQWHMERI